MIATLIYMALGLGLFFSALLILRILHRIDNKLAVGNIHASNLVEALEALRLTSRARVGQVGNVNKAGDEEAHLVKVGHAAKTRRVVAGGDPSSEQHKRLTEQLGGDDG